MTSSSKDDEETGKEREAQRRFRYGTPVTENPDQPEHAQLRASDADRERVAKTLHNALSEGRITIAELDERIATVYRAKTLAELEPVVSDLPGTAISSPAGSAQTPSTNLPENRIGGAPGSTSSIAIMSGADRKGVWVLPPQHNSFALWGGVEIDLRQAHFAEKHSTITAVAIMGGVDIDVPDDIVVEVNGVGIMGAFETHDKKGAAESAPPDAPVVRVNGLAFWGGVTVNRFPRDQRKKKLE